MLYKIQMLKLKELTPYSNLLIAEGMVSKAHSVSKI